MPITHTSICGPFLFAQDRLPDSIVEEDNVTPVEWKCHRMKPSPVAKTPFVLFYIHAWVSGRRTLWYYCNADYLL